MVPKLHRLTLILVTRIRRSALAANDRRNCVRQGRSRKNCSDARTDPTRANDIYCGKAASWRLAGVAAEARDGIHRSASRGGDSAGRSRRTRRSKPVSFCARVHAILRRASASISYGATDGSREEPVAEAGALGDTDRHPDRLSRGQFLHQGISQVHWTYADRISASSGGLTYELLQATARGAAFFMPLRRTGTVQSPCRKHRPHSSSFGPP
jgi:hypothetical protein